MLWCGTTLCVGYKKAYALVDTTVTTTAATAARTSGGGGGNSGEREVMVPLEGARPCMTVISASRILVVSNTNLGIFIDADTGAPCAVNPMVGNEWENESTHVIFTFIPLLFSHSYACYFHIHTLVIFTFIRLLFSHSYPCYYFAFFY
jgi:hypothetical protein